MIRTFLSGATINGAANALADLSANISAETNSAAIDWLNYQAVIYRCVVQITNQTVTFTVQESDFANFSSPSNIGANLVLTSVDDGDSRWIYVDRKNSPDRKRFMRINALVGGAAANVIAASLRIEPDGADATPNDPNIIYIS